MEPWEVGFHATGGFLAPAFAGDSVATWAPPEGSGSARWLDEIQSKVRLKRVPVFPSLALDHTHILIQLQLLLNKLSYFSTRTRATTPSLCGGRMVVPRRCLCRFTSFNVQFAGGMCCCGCALAIWT